MRILLVNTRHYFGGGDSTYTFNLAQLLTSRGHKTAFFAMQSDENLPDPNADLFVSFIDFSELNRNKNLITGMKVIWRSIYSVEAKNKFKKLVHRFKPDIIHLQSIHGHITPSIIFEAKKVHIPIVWTLHDYRLLCPNQNMIIDRNNKICKACLERSFYCAVLKRCKKDSLLASIAASLEGYGHRFLRVRELVDFFLSPSRFLKQLLIKQGFRAQKIKHIPNMLFNSNLKRKNVNKRFILYIGMLRSIKGIYQLIKACIMKPHIKVVLAGRAENSIKSELLPFLPENVSYVGMKRGQEFQTLMQNASAIVLPSLCYENQPFSILEAFIHAKPVITSNIGGMAELVTHQERGLLVDPGDVLALASAMEWIEQNPKKAESLGQNALEYVLREHTAEVHYARLMSIYENCLGA